MIVESLWNIVFPDTTSRCTQHSSTCTARPLTTRSQQAQSWGSFFYHTRLNLQIFTTAWPEMAFAQDQRQMFFCVNLDPPIKQGQTRYHYLIFSFMQVSQKFLELLPPKLQRRGLVFKRKLVTMERVWWVTIECEEWLLWIVKNGLLWYMGHTCQFWGLWSRITGQMVTVVFDDVSIHQYGWII